MNPPKRFHGKHTVRTLLVDDTQNDNLAEFERFLRFIVKNPRRLGFHQHVFRIGIHDHFR